MKFTRVTAVCILAICAASPAFASEFKWGAIAIDTEKAEKEPAFGVGGADTEQEASDLALGFCTEAEGKVCKTIVAYEKCGALAVNGTGTAGWGKAPTKEEAEAQAIAGCENAECKIVVSDCNE